MTKQNVRNSSDLCVIAYFDNHPETEQESDARKPCLFFVGLDAN